MGSLQVFFDANIVLCAPGGCYLYAIPKLRDSGGLSARNSIPTNLSRMIGSSTSMESNIKISEKPIFELFS